jgi:hypothetical protein
MANIGDDAEGLEIAKLKGERLRNIEIVVSNSDVNNNPFEKNFHYKSILYLYRVK